MISFDDSVTAGNLPADQKHGVYYVDGAYANEAAVRARLPEATLLGITVFGKVGKGIQCCDCEQGDLTVNEAVEWVAASLKAGVYRPRVYADSDTWDNQGLWDALAHYGSSIGRWVAAYPGTGANVPAGYDCHQWAGGITSGVDKNVALDTFFDMKAPTPPKPTPKPQPKPVPKPKPAKKKNTGKASFTGDVDLKDGTWTVHMTEDGKHTFGPTKMFQATVTLSVAEGHGGTFHIHKVKL